MAKEHRVTTFSPFNRGADQATTKTFLPAGFVHSADNLVFDRGLVKKRRGFARRTRGYDGNFAVTAVAAGAGGTFTVAEDLSMMEADDTFVITGSTENDATWTVASTSGSGPTVITVDAGETVTADVSGLGTISSVSSLMGPRTNVNLPLASDQPVIALPNFWPTSGLQKEVVIGDKLAYEFDFGTGNYTTVFTETGGGTDVQCFATGAPYASWTPVPVNISHAISPGIVFTDGQAYSGNHTVYYYNGTQVSGGDAATSLSNGSVDFSGLTSFDFCKQVIWFADHFMIGNYSDNSDHYRQGVAWGDFQSLGIQGGASSDFGEVIIADAKGTLQRFIRLGASLVIYFTNSIVVCDPVPTTNIYDFDVRVQGTGLLGPNAVVDVGGVHFALGNDTVFAYDGGLAPRSIGDRISELLFSAINASATDAIVAQHLPRKNEVHWFVPTGDSTVPDAVLIYNYREDAFSTLGLVSKNITAAGIGVRNISYRCSDEPFTSAVCNPTGDFSTADYSDMACSDFAHTSGFSLPTLGSSDGYHYDYDDVHFLEDVTVGSTLTGGSAIPSELITDTKALGKSEGSFGSEHGEYGTFGRVSELYIESRGTVFRVHYSIDDGETFTAINRDFGGFSGFQRERVPMDITAKFLTFKLIFPPNGGSTAIRSLGIRSRGTSVRGL